MKQLAVPKNLEIIISSYGGVGTTYVIDFLSRYKKTNHYTNLDRLKHIAKPPISFNSKQKFIYLFGNPVYSTISLFRRNYQVVYARTLNKYLENPISEIQQEMTIDDYGKNGEDVFQFKEHFHNWYYSKIPKSILYVRYESLYNHLDTVLEFAGISHAIEDFPPQKKRSSCLTDIPDRTLRQLTAIHSDFLQELETVPDIVLRDRRDLHFLDRTSLRFSNYSKYFWFISRRTGGRIKKRMKALI